MKCKILLLLPILLFAMLPAQSERPLHVSHWTYLYKQPHLNSEKLGVFATEASVKLLDSLKNFYKIQADNGDVGYIKQQKLTKSMRGKKDADEPAAYFYRGTQGSQCPHLYVQASGLRARNAPNTNSKIVEILPINQLECVEYVPLSANGWVYIGDYFHEKPKYVQYKFLGKEISFDETLQEFKKTTSAEKKKLLLERLVEMGWNSTPDKTLMALKLLRDYHQKQGTLHTVSDIEFEIFLAENMQNPLSSLEKAEYNYNKIKVVMQGIEIIVEKPLKLTTHFRMKLTTCFGLN